MATINTGNLTLSDWARRLEDDKVAAIVPILLKVNPILQDIPYVEANLPTGHKTTIRSGLPAVTFRQLYGGVQPSKSRTIQVTDSIGMLEAYSEVDKALADLNGNRDEFLFSEAESFIEAMSQEMATTFFFGNTNTEPEKFMGLSPRYNDLSAESGSNIIDAGGTGSDNASIWLITWDKNLTHGIFPKGSMAGLLQENLGQETLTDAAGGLFEGFRSHFKWDSGLVVRDFRYNVRIANIDTSDLQADNGVPSAGADIISSMIRAIHKIPFMEKGNQVFYVNELVMTFLDLQTLKQSNMNVSYQMLPGAPGFPHGEGPQVRTMMFRGIPVKKTEALLNTEAQVT